MGHYDELYAATHAANLKAEKNDAKEGRKAKKAKILKLHSDRKISDFEADVGLAVLKLKALEAL